VNHFNIRTSAKVVVNRVLSDKEGEVTFNKFKNASERFLKIELEHLGNISEDRRLIQSVREQRPFVINYPNCEAATDLKKVALRLIGSNNNKKGEGVQGLFKKIFSIFS
jgi:flagellar biosynthesis protein FlhG